MGHIPFYEKELICENCGIKFTPEKPDQKKVCSKKCRYELCGKKTALKLKGRKDIDLDVIQRKTKGFYRFSQFRKGKSNIEVFGEEKAKRIIEKFINKRYKIPFNKITKPQKELFNYIKSKFDNVVMEYYIETKFGRRFIDIAIPDMKIGIEYYGGYWHNSTHSQVKDFFRNYFIVEKGWKICVIRNNEYKDNKLIDEKLSKILNGETNNVFY